MKKFLLLILLFLFPFIYCFPQVKTANNIRVVKVKKGLEDSISMLERKVNFLEKKLKISDSIKNQNLVALSQSINSTKKSINGSGLKETIKSAETTISFENIFVQVFGVLFAVIAIIVGILYFISIRPLMKQTKTALKRVNLATGKLENKIEKFEKEIDDKINKRFELFEKTLKEKEIEEIFNDIESNLENRRRLQIERLTRGDFELSSHQIDRLFKVLDTSNLSEHEKSTLIGVLTQINNYQIQKYFAIWKNVKKEELIIIDILYNYYMNNDLKSFMVPIRHFILNRVDPHIELNRLIDKLPSRPDFLIEVINDKMLIDSLENQSRISVKNHIEESLESWSLVKRDNIEASYLFQKK